MAYVFYFLGFVTMYRVSERVDESKNESHRFHFIVALIWPLVVVLALVYDIYKLAIEE